MKKGLKRPLSILLAVMMIVSLFTVAPVTTAGAAEVTDTLTASDFTATTTTYSDFSGVSKDSGAVYAGQSAKDSSGNIQLRSRNSNSGIVSTASGGTLKSVKITVGTGTGTIDVYGSNNAYSAASDLYGNNKGTKIGSLTSTGTITPSSDYSYVGIRSNSGAIYLSKVEITWDDGSGGTVTPTYTVTWKNGNDVIETDTDVESGSYPHFDGTDPSDYTEGDYDYTFDGWTSDNGAHVYYNGGFPQVTGDVTYYAHFNKTAIPEYTVYWYDNEDDLNELGSEDYKEGATPSYSGATPTKDSDDTYNYYFNHKWKDFDSDTVYDEDDLPPVSGETYYIAQYDAILISEDTLRTDVITRHTTSITDGSYHDWSNKSSSNPQNSGITSNAVYAGKSAGGNSAIQLRSTGSDCGIVTTTSGGYVTKITIKWNDNTSDDGRTLDIYGDNTAYTAPSELYSSPKGTLLGSLDYKVNNSTTTELIIDGEYRYFGLRSKSGAMYIDEIDVIWDTSAEGYTVTWKNRDGSTNYSQSGLASGATPEYDGTVPEDYSDDDYDYTFAGWKKSGDDTVYTDVFPEVTSDVVYTPYFEATAIPEFTVEWYNDEDDDDPLLEETYKRGATPSYSGATPSKDSDGNHNYYFSHQWKDFSTDVIYADDALPEVNGDTIYIAQFEEVLIQKYTVTWNDYNGSNLETDENVNKNTDPEYNGDTPTRESDANYSYTFIGWSPALAPVTKDVTYTAVYSAVPLSYSGRVVRTDTGDTLEIGGKYYDYNGETRQIDADCAFDDLDVEYYGYLFLGNQYAAIVDIPADAVYAHSVYVTGSGTENDPYVFTPNFIYSKPNAGSVGNGVSVSASAINPGDGFAMYSRISVGGNASVLFMQHTDDEALVFTQSNIGVGEGSYGNVYPYDSNNKKAGPYTFMNDNTALFYLGSTDGTRVFTEYVPYSDTLGEALTPFTVTWNNYDGVEIYSDEYYAGQSPTYKDEVPSHPEETECTYSFIGWKKAGDDNLYTDTFPAVDGDVTYTAQFSRTDKQTYTVTWYDGDLDELAVETYYEGQKPSYKGNTPTMETDTVNQTRYIFNDQWVDYDDIDHPIYSNDLPGVTKNTDYIAQFDPDYYLTVTWYDDDYEVLLFEDTYTFGSVPSYPNAAPEKQGDSDYYYVFSGWRDADTDVFYPSDNPLPELYLNKDYIAVYQEIAYRPMVIWYDYDMTELLSQLDVYDFGDQAVYEGEEPTREDADGCYYVFIGWKDKDTGTEYDKNMLPALLKDTEFIAVYDEIKYAPHVTWWNYDWAEDEAQPLLEEDYTALDTPTYKGATPTKPEYNDGTYTYRYEFSGWDPVPAPLTDDEDYIAHFNEYKVYTVTWKDDDGSTLREDTVREGDTPDYGSTPTKADDATYTYTFNSWTPEIEEVTGDAEYTAQYDRAKLRPVVYWLDWYGRVLPGCSEEYNAYDVPTYKGETPTKPSDSYSYTFNGQWMDWETEEVYDGDELPALTDDVKYQPMFDKTLIPTHTITWVTHEGTKETACREGFSPEYGGTPAKYYDNGVGYEFSGWSDGTNTYSADEDLPAVTGPATYTAQYTAVAADIFTVTWANYDGSEITHETVMEGTIPEYPSDVAPIRASTGEHSYTFAGWKDSADLSAEPTVYGAEDEMPAVMSNVTYIAVYSEGPSDINGILPTNDGSYYTVGGAWFMYNDGETVEKRQFESDVYLCFIESDDDGDGVGTLLLGSEIDPDSPSYAVDIINTVPAYQYQPHGHKDLTHTVYVYGSGTEDDPYEFHVNYLYYDNVHQNVSGADIILADIRDMHPGDQFRGNSRISIFAGGVDYVTFSAAPDVKDVPDNGYLGIGRNNYGYKYVNANAVESDNGNGPYPYEDGKNTIYYHGVNSAGDSHLFSTEEADYRNDLVGSEDYSGYIITWENWNGDELPYSPEKYAENAIPSYKGSTPTRPEDDAYTYVFDGWEHEIVPVTYSFTYKAKYIAIPKPLTVIWQNYDGTVLEKDLCSPGDIPSYTGENPEKPGYSRFTYTHSGWADDENEYSLSGTMPAVTENITYTATFTESSKLFTGHSITLQGDIGVNFFLDVTPEELTTGSGVLVKFSWNVEGNVKRSEFQMSTDLTEARAKAKKVGDKVYYRATCWVAAAEMAYNIHAVAYINGVEQTETNDYSVREYGMEIINSEAGTYGAKHAQLVDLAKKMLDYGSKAQVVFARPADGLANRDVTDYTMTEITADTITSKKSDMKENNEELGLAYQGSTIVYLSKTSLRHYYKVTDSSKLESAKAAAAEAGFTYGAKDGMVYFEKADISAKNLDAAYTISFGDGFTYNYSVLDYSKSVLTKDSSSVPAKELAMATYWYNKAAHIYFD